MQWINQNINLANGSAEEKRQEIRNYFINTYEQYETIFELLKSEEVFVKSANNLRHPLMFYFGHTATFFINKFVLAGLIDERIDERLESIFAIGVDEMSWDDLNENNYKWPSVSEAKNYRNLVKQKVLDVIDHLEFTMPIDWNSPMWTVMMGIEHERIHLETSSVLIRQLPIEDVVAHKKFPLCPIFGANPKNELIKVSGKKVKLGVSRSNKLYGWDNEFGEAEFDVNDFEASKFLVSNGEFLDFINDSGYYKDEFWDEEGLGWKNFHKAKHPEFWIEKNGSYLLRTLSDEIDLPLNWPAEVCYLEAKAFCNWKSKKSGKTIRMPDEAEYRRLLEVSDLDHEHSENSIKANWNLEQYASSTPVDQNQHGDFFDLVGNVWQWNETPIYGFDGFEVHPYYDDFSVPTFDNRHNLIKGGSWASTGNEITLNSRYAFRRHFYQHSGFRYVASDQIVNKEFDVYETDKLVSNYCEFHYGEDNFGVPNFCKAIAEEALRVKPSGKKALDIGASVGRVSFELADSFDHVDSLDFSARFIQVGSQLQKNRRLKYERIEEGDLVSFQERSLDSLGLTEKYDNINFMQQDATNMKSHFTNYDLVVACNLIDRLYDPLTFLQEISTRINKDGVLLISSPYSWSEEFTEKSKWLGGYRHDGEPVSTLDSLKDILSKEFELIEKVKDIPFVIRETKRKFQHGVSQLSLWRKK